MRIENYFSKVDLCNAEKEKTHCTNPAIIFILSVQHHNCLRKRKKAKQTCIHTSRSNYLAGDRKVN